MTEDKKDKGFTIVDNSVFDNKELSPMEKLTLMYLIRYQNDEKGYSFPSLETLKIQMNYSHTRYVIKNISSLIEKGYLKKETIKQRNRYYILNRVQNVPYVQIVPDVQNVPEHDVQNVPEYMVQNVPSTNTNINTNTNTKYSSLDSKEIEKINISNKVIEYLNEKADTNFRSSTKPTRKVIDARANDGYSLEDFKKVIDIKVMEWKGTDFEQYLRPSTLFGNKFESYLNQKPKEAIRNNNYDDLIKI